MNKVLLVGNLCKDVELTQTPNGISLCKFNIAVNRKYEDSEGNKVVDFFNIITWRTLAENCAKWLKKGKKVLIEGEVNNRTYETQNGEKRTITEIVASEVEFLSPKDTTEEPVKATRPTLEPIEDDNLPF